MKKRHSAEQIVGLLRQADVSLGKGEKVPEVCKQLGISEQTYYRWRTKYGGMDPQLRSGSGCGRRQSRRPVGANRTDGQRVDPFAYRALAVQRAGENFDLHLLLAAARWALFQSQLGTQVRARPPRRLAQLPGWSAIALANQLGAVELPLKRAGRTLEPIAAAGETFGNDLAELAHGGGGSSPAYRSIVVGGWQ